MGGDTSQAKATYRFYANPRVDRPALQLRSPIETTQRSLDQDILLVVQVPHTQFRGFRAGPGTGPNRLPAGSPEGSALAPPPWP